MTEFPGVLMLSIDVFLFVLLECLESHIPDFNARHKSLSQLNFSNKAVWIKVFALVSK